MKGQVFLLTAGIVIAILVVLKGAAIISQISSEREILDVSLENLIFDNIDSESRRIITISASTPNKISDNVIDFLNFTRNGNARRSLDFRALFVGILANKTSQTMNITVFQFLKETNLNVTIELNSSPVQRNSTLLNDSEIMYSNFTFTPGEHYYLTLTLPDRGYEQNITIKTRGGKDVYTGFFDIRMISERATHVSRFQQEAVIR